jgi:hypothetical protein
MAVPTPACHPGPQAPVFVHVCVAGAGGRGWRPLECTRARRAVIAASVCATLVVAVALVASAMPRNEGLASLSLQSLLERGTAVEFKVPTQAAAGEVVEVDAPGAPAQEVQIPAGAQPGEEVYFTIASSITPTRAPAHTAAEGGDEEVEFKVPASSSPGAMLDVDVPGVGVREVELPAGARPGEELGFVVQALALGGGRPPGRGGGGGGGGGEGGEGGEGGGGAATAAAGAGVASAVARQDGPAAAVAGAGSVSARSVSAGSVAVSHTHALAAGASDAAAVASAPAGAAAKGVAGGGAQGGATGEGAENVGNGQAAPGAGTDLAMANKIAAGFNPRTGKWRGTADDPFGYEKRELYYEQEHEKQVAEWTKFIAEQHAQV